MSDTPTCDYGSQLPYTPNRILAGRREAMLAEYACPEYVEGKYLVTYADPEGHQWDTEGLPTIKDVRAEIAWAKATYPGIKVDFI